MNNLGSMLLFSLNDFSGDRRAKLETALDDFSNDRVLTFDKDLYDRLITEDAILFSHKFQ
jgi:hypothetical protein